MLPVDRYDTDASLSNPRNHERSKAEYFKERYPAFRDEWKSRMDSTYYCKDDGLVTLKSHEPDASSSGKHCGLSTLDGETRKVHKFVKSTVKKGLSKARSLQKKLSRGDSSISDTSNSKHDSLNEARQGMVPSQSGAGAAYTNTRTRLDDNDEVGSPRDDEAAAQSSSISDGFALGATMSVESHQMDDSEVDGWDDRTDYKDLNTTQDTEDIDSSDGSLGQEEDALPTEDSVREMIDEIDHVLFLP